MIESDVRGEGETVLLLHSGGMSGRQWRRLADQLSRSFRVVSPDFLGSGANPRWPDDTPFDFHADVAAVFELIDELGPRVHLVGHSYGGFIALTVARERPDSVRSLVAYDPVAFGVLYEAEDREGLADLARASENPVFSDDASGGQEPWFQAFVDYWSGVGAWAGLPAAQRSAFLEVGRKVYGEVKTLLADRTPAAAYANILAPTLLLTGERSPASVLRVTSLLTQALPSARREVVSQAGHMGPITHAAAVNALIEQHLTATLRLRVL